VPARDANGLSRTYFMRTWSGRAHARSSHRRRRSRRQSIRDDIDFSCPRVTDYRVATAKESIEYLRREGRFQNAGSPSILVCNLNMPGMSGFDFAAQMKKDPALIVH